MFCGEEETKHAGSSQWMKWKKVTKVTHQYVPWQCAYSPINVTFSCPCAHHNGIWDRGSTSPHITNPVLLHTVPSDNILATICSINLPFFHKISLAIKTGDSFTHYISWNPYFHGLLVFSITYPHSLALYECVWSASHSTCITLGENAECQLNRRVDGPEICPGSPEEMKNLLTLPGN